MVSSTFKEFQTVCEGEIWCLCVVIFDQKNSKLNSGPVYCFWLYGTLKDKIGSFGKWGKRPIQITEFTGATGQCSTLDAVCCCSQCLKLFLKSVIFLKQLYNKIFRKYSCYGNLKVSRIISRKSNFIVVYSERVLTRCSEMFAVSTRPCRVHFILTRNVFWSDNFLHLLGLILCKTILR